MIKVNEKHNRYLDFMDFVDQYEYGKQGSIKSSGKFEGEQFYVPWFWDRCLNSAYEEIYLDDIVHYIVELDSDDYDLLSFDPDTICAFILYEDELGFVHSHAYSKLEIASFKLRILLEIENDPVDEVY